MVGRNSSSMSGIFPGLQSSEAQAIEPFQAAKQVPVVSSRAHQLGPATGAMFHRSTPLEPIKSPGAGAGGGHELKPGGQPTANQPNEDMG
ncbi:hypothetical protein ACJZ2D_011362 [Fusarium nematophilum]